MSYGTQTITATYTRVDIRKVFEAVEAELRMAVTRTEIKSASWATEMAHDLRHFAENGALHRAHLILSDALGREIRALVFSPTDAALGWVDERPKANRWPSLPSGTMQVVVEYTATFKALPESKKMAIKSGCLLTWGPSGIDISHAGLRATRSQQHASNGYGVDSTDYAP